MADIDVVKKGSRTWLWILMLVVAALIVWFLMAGRRPPTQGRLDMGGQPLTAAAFTARG